MNYSIIYANIINQAGEVGSRCHSLTRSDVEAVCWVRQAILCVLSHCDAINVDESFFLD